MKTGRGQVACPKDRPRPMSSITARHPGFFSRKEVVYGHTRIVQLGTPRATGEGLRLGTVRRTPRGVPKAEFASRNYYDVWLPELAPSEQLVKAARQATDTAAWNSFVKRYRNQMKQPKASVSSSMPPRLRRRRERTQS